MAYTSAFQGATIDSKLSTPWLAKNELLNLIYPVGSIYLSTTSTSPATFLGGTWERIQDKFLLCAGTSYTAGNTGGSATHTHTSAAHSHGLNSHTHTTADHTLTINEIPSHNHNIYSQAGATETGAGWVVRAINAKDENQLIGSVAKGGGASHNHGTTGAASGNTASTIPGATGSSSSLPPYLAVYCWKRVS